MAALRVGAANAGWCVATDGDGARPPRLDEVQWHRDAAHGGVPRAVAQHPQPSQHAPIITLSFLMMSCSEGGSRALSAWQVVHAAAAGAAGAAATVAAGPAAAEGTATAAGAAAAAPRLFCRPHTLHSPYRCCRRRRGCCHWRRCCCNLLGQPHPKQLPPALPPSTHYV